MSLLGTALALLVAAAPAPQVSQKAVGPRGDIYQMNGSFEVDVSPDVAWDVLTDYGNHPKFLANLKSSVVKERRDNVALVAQEAIGKVAMFSATVQMTMQMKEIDHREIAFTDLLKKDFSVFNGGWRMTPRPKGVRVEYVLRCLPNAKAPGFIMGPMMDDTTRQLMVSMRSEMEKRARVSVAVR